LAYGRTILRWDAALESIRDRRKQGQIPTGAIVRALVTMFFCRLGSLNALGQTRSSSWWHRWLGRALPSPDTIGRVAGLIELDDVRALGQHLYQRLKRGKALNPPAHGWLAAVLDGQEVHASFKRHCPGCLERTIHTKRGDRIQYYHRLVAVSLVTQDLRVLLDAEPQRAGEDEIAAALRLLDRVVQVYPRAFDLVQGDGLYTDPRFFQWAAAYGKYALAVLKDERRDLLQEAQQLFESRAPVLLREGNTLRECWDLEGFRTWPQAAVPVRVVRSRETRSVRRQLDKQVHREISEGYWVTTLPTRQAPTGTVVQLGHGRWDIENQGFNELVNQWHADHVYRHEPTALLVFWLLAQICLTVFCAFFRRNLKPAAQAALTRLHVARLVQAELYLSQTRAPP
jgi:hypothetical protein